MYRNAERYADPTVGRALYEIGKKSVVNWPQPKSPSVLRISEKEQAKAQRARINAKLHSCWFCKGDAELVTAQAQNGHPPMAMARCKKCGAKGPSKYMDDPVQPAIDAWNGVGVLWAF
jgi:hypothetical protein